MKRWRISRLPIIVAVFLLPGCGPAPDQGVAVVSDGTQAALTPALNSAEAAPTFISAEAPSTSPPTPNEARRAAYYVSPLGNDSNPGTESRPWRTIQTAAETLVAGDTVYIRAGTYEERVSPQHSGSPGSEIVYAAYPSETPVIDGANVVVPEWSGLFDVTGQHYIRVSGLHIVNAGPNIHNPGILVEGSSDIVIENNYIARSTDSGIGVWQSQNVILDHNEVEQVCTRGYNEGISVGGTDGFEVRHNRVHDGQKEGIGAKDGSSNGKVWGNEVYGTGAVGIYVDAWDKHTHDIEVFRNVVHDVAANGLAIASEQGGLLENVRVYNNVAYGNKWVGIHVSPCCSDTHPMRNVQIVNNTLFNNGWDPWGGGILLDNPQAEQVLIRNNLCSQNLYFQMAVDPGVPPANATIDHNLIDGFRGTEGEIYGNDYVEGDPLFASAAGANLRLKAGSPAVDRGSAAGAPADDFDGQPRPQGAAVDIGADEYFPVSARVYLPRVLTEGWKIAGNLPSFQSSIYCRYGKNSGPSSSRLMIRRMIFIVPSAPME